MLKKVRVCDKCGKAESPEVQMVTMNSRFKKEKELVGTIRMDYCLGCFEMAATTPGFRATKAKQ